MSVVYNPKIVTDGLVLSLDAANSKSYPGSGTTWFDLSGNGNHATLFGASFENTCFNFNGTNQYARTTNTLDLSPYNSITVEIGVKMNTTNISSGMTFEHSSDWNSNISGFGLVLNSSGSYTYVNDSHHTNHNSGSTALNYNGVVGTDITVHTNIWSKVADPTGRNAYINAIERTNLTGSKVTSTYSNFRNDYFYMSSRGGSSGFSNQKIYFVRVYGKKLTPTEIQQNFNAIRGRFGV